MTDIILHPHSKKINLLVNGPLSHVKITRHSSAAFKNENQTASRAVAAGQEDWWIEKNHPRLQENDKSKSCQRDSSSIIPSEDINVEVGSFLTVEHEQAFKASLQLSKDLALKREKLEVSRGKLRDRLKESALKKAEAFQKVLAQYHKDSIDNHAPYLTSNGQTPRARQKLEDARLAAIIPKALSVEDLNIAELPYQRPYMILGKEKYTLHQKYFDFDLPKQESSQILQDREKIELEKELRTSYRVGHLDEIKRKQFGKVYNETRQYYMDLERFQFLQEQTLRNEKKKKTSKKIKPPPAAQVQTQKIRIL